MSCVLRVLRTRQLPILQQLKLEEALLRATKDNWLIINDGARTPAVVMGISGNAHKLVDIAAAEAANVQLIKRFSGGGTVVVDSNTVFVTMIFQQSALPDVAPFPKAIMEFTGEVYSDVFSSCSRDASRVPRTRHTSLTKDQSLEFALLENDYVYGSKKVAGNAQAIIKDRWLHHTSFLWDYRSDRMALLKEPDRRPQYRGTRKHGSFLTSLISLGLHRQEFLETIEDAFACRGFQPELAVMDEMEALLSKDYLRSTRVIDYGDLAPGPS